MDGKQAKEKLSEISYCDSMEPGHQIETVLLDPDDANEIAALIEQQSQSITDLQQRLRELDERNQTQAQVLTARDGIIQRQSDKIAESGKLIERQEKIIDRAIGQLRKSGCPIFIAKKCLDQQEPLASECPPDRCWQRWLEEVGK